MPIIPVTLPAGMYRNGTSYSARGRWTDGNLVRWHDGSLRPIGGWQQRTDSAGDPVTLPATGEQIYRDAISYRILDGEREALWFSNLTVQRMVNSGGISDVTPIDYPVGSSDPSLSTGYGSGPYGMESYGTRRTAAGLTPDPVHRVGSSMWGENPLFAVVNNGPIYQYVPGAPAALPLSNAPTDVADIIVTEQRIVMAIKNSPEIRTVVWSDRENNNDWTPTVSNYADSRILQGTGDLVGLYSVQNQILILSENDAHVARFIGAPYVYGIDKIGTRCGPAAANAVAKEQRFAIWLGRRNFWLYDGTLKPIECDVMDYLIDDIDFDDISKIHTQSISDFSEIWWFYQSKSSDDGEVDSYIVFDHKEGHWATGRLARTVGVDSGPFSYPIMADKDGILYNHELADVLASGAYCVSGPLELENGGRNMAVRYVLPDTQYPNSVTLDFFTRQMPTDDVVIHGPFEYNNPISTTGVLGREVQMRVNGLTNDWEVGTMRFDVQTIGGGFR